MKKEIGNRSMNKGRQQSLDLINIGMGRSNKPSILKKDSCFFDASTLLESMENKIQKAS
jgi:hypothetical protein